MNLQHIWELAAKAQAMRDVPNEHERALYEAIEAARHPSSPNPDELEKLAKETAYNVCNFVSTCELDACYSLILAALKKVASPNPDTERPKGSEEKEA